MCYLTFCIYQNISSVSNVIDFIHIASKEKQPNDPFAFRDVLPNLLAFTITISFNFRTEINLSGLKTKKKSFCKFQGTGFYIT